MINEVFVLMLLYQNVAHQFWLVCAHRGMARALLVRTEPKHIVHAISVVYIETP